MYSEQIRMRIETQFGRLFLQLTHEQPRIELVYRAITWSVGTGLDHVLRKQRSVAFIRDLLAYAERMASDAAAANIVSVAGAKKNEEE